MSAPTTGPWRANGNQVEKDLYGDSGPTVIIARTAGNDDESSANARLIAAAPELLEALKEQVAECFDDLCEMCARHEALIARATGEAA